jgi:hypothetical protein
VLDRRCDIVRAFDDVDPREAQDQPTVQDQAVLTMEVVSKGRRRAPKPSLDGDAGLRIREVDAPDAPAEPRKRACR